DLGRVRGQPQPVPHAAHRVVWSPLAVDHHQRRQPRERLPARRAQRQRTGVYVDGRRRRWGHAEGPGGGRKATLTDEGPVQRTGPTRLFRRVGSLDQTHLVDRFARTLAPTEAVLRTMQGDHAHAVILRVATRAARNDDVVTGLQRPSGNTLTAELTGAAPLNGVTHH